MAVFGGNVANSGYLREIRGRIAYMPQGLGRNLYPTLSVFENIDFFGRLFGQGAEERRARITELLTATAMEKFEARPAGKLSGGMKQKLSLCCALINDPDLLILDEANHRRPIRFRGQFWDLINSIRARRPQMSVMVATAYMDEAQRFDWLMAMDEGKIIATGTLKELLDKTGEPNLDEAFIALMPRPSGPSTRRSSSGLEPSPDETPAIEAEGLTSAVRRLRRGRSRQFQNRAGRDFSALSLTAAASDDDEDADGVPCRPRAAGANCSASRWARATWRRGAASSYMTQAALALRRTHGRSGDLELRTALSLAAGENCAPAGRSVGAL